MRPRFEHDCEACVFLGASLTHDFYFCRGNVKKPVEETATVIARFGSDGPDYASGLEIALAVENKDPEYPLVRALQLARKQGLLPQEML